MKSVVDNNEIVNTTPLIINCGNVSLNQLEYFEFKFVVLKRYNITGWIPN